MSPSEQSGARKAANLKVDVANLYREEAFTDLKAGSLRRLTPVKPDGSPDMSRQPIFLGEATVLSAAGPLPIQCPIEARTLQEAAAKFPQAVERAVEEMIAQAKELRRQQASRIVVPKPGMGPPMGPGKIQLT